MTETEALILQAINNLSEDIKGIKSDIKDLKTTSDNQSERIKEIEADVKILKMTNENEIVPILKMLLEYQLSNSERFIKLEKSNEEIKDDIEINEVIRKINMRSIN